MQERVYRNTIDKTNWGPGPWQDELDKKQWGDPETGLPCLIVRNHLGALCGYVGVPPGHPAYGKGYDELDMDLEVHGGLTYSAPCQLDEQDVSRTICHLPDEGEPDEVWWLGFDTCHCFDYQPGMAALLPHLLIQEGEYRNLTYVTAEVQSLARQLASLGG